MKSIHIREIPDQTLKNLKRRATRNHRSLQQEVRWLLEAAADRMPPDSAKSLDLVFSKTRKPDEELTWSRNQIYDETGR